MKNSLILILLCSCFSFSCKPDNGNKDKEASINLTGSIYNIDYKAQTIKVGVRSDDIEWTFGIKDESWAIPSVTKGESTKTFEVEIKRNSSLESRETIGILKYVLNGVQGADTLTITQAGETLQLNITESNFNIKSDGDIIEFGLASNAPYKVTHSPDWARLVTTRALDTIKMYASVDPNTSYSFRKGSIEFAQTEDESVINQINIYQFGIGNLETDSLALVDIYNATNGASWTKKWNLSQPLKSWFGVELKEGIQGIRVTSLKLQNNNLDGKLPASISNLAYIENLWLNDNKIIGELPSDFGNLQNLIFLYLYNNSLSGVIPESLGNATSISRLYLQNNNFSGTIPSTLANITNLDGLGLNNNNLTGELPEELGKLKLLYVLTLNNNRLSGTIPNTYINNNNATSWNAKVEICPQQEGYGFNNCEQLHNPFED